MSNLIFFISQRLLPALVIIGIISFLIIKRKKLPFWVSWGIAGLIIGYAVTFVLVINIFEGNLSGPCLTNIYCIGEPFVMSFMGFFIYIPSAIIFAFAAWLYGKLKKRV